MRRIVVRLPTRRFEAEAIFRRMAFPALIPAPALALSLVWSLALVVSAGSGDEWSTSRQDGRTTVKEETLPLPNNGYTLGDWTAHHPGSIAEVAAIGDVTGDGRADVVIATTWGQDPDAEFHAFVYPQLGDGTLGSPTGYDYGVPTDDASIVLADLNEDAVLDIIIGHVSGLTVFLADGQGGFDEYIPVPDADARSLRAMDVDLDAHMDIISLGWSRGLSIFYGKGDGFFREIQPMQLPIEGTTEHELEDLNNDGHIDLAVLSIAPMADSQLMVFLHDAVGGFVEQPESYTTEPYDSLWGFGLGDVNRDGRHDAVLSRVANSPNHISIFTQNSSGVLTGPTTMPSHDAGNPVEVTDLNGDGLEDIVVVHGGFETVGIYLQGTQGLQEEVLYTMPYSTFYKPQSLAVGDFSSDDCADIAIADDNNGLVVFYGSGCVGSPFVFSDGFESGDTSAWSWVAP